MARNQTRGKVEQTHLANGKPLDALSIPTIAKQYDISQSTIRSAINAERYASIFTPETIFKDKAYIEDADMTIDITYVSKAAIDAWRAQVAATPAGRKPSGAGKRISIRVDAANHDAVLAWLKDAAGVTVIERAPRAPKVVDDNGNPIKRGRKSSKAVAPVTPAVPLESLFQPAPLKEDNGVVVA